MKKLFTLFLTFFTCGLAYNTTAQQANYSQYFSNPLYLNPAYAGSAKCSQFAAQYRYGGFLGSFESDQAITTSYDQPLGKSSSLGIQFTYESLYDISAENFCLDAIYAHKFQLNEDFSIRPALSVGILRGVVHWDRLIFQDQFSSPGSYLFPNTADKITVLDLRFGIITQYKNLTIGASIDHLNEPKFKYTNFSVAGENKIEGRLFIHADYMAKISDNLTLRPGFVMEEYLIKNSNSIYLPSLRFEFSKLSLGAATRIFNGEVISLIGMAGYTAKKVGFMASYDLNGSKYMSHNSLELTAYFRFACDN